MANIKPVFLTDAMIRKLKRPSRQLEEIRDTSTLILRNFPDGAKVFAWRFIDHHAGGKKQRIDYGSYPAVSLEQARHIHGLMTAARKDGKDIMSNSIKLEILKQVLGEDAVKMEARPEGMTLNEVYDKFIKDYVEPNNIEPRPYRRIKNHILPKLGEEVVDAIPEETMKKFMLEFQEGRTQTTISDTIRFAVSMCNHARQHFWINTNPFAELGVKRKNKVRRIYYTMEEIRTLLLNPDDLELGKDYHLIHKSILLSGCRISEVMEAEIKEFDFLGGIWTIPLERLKNQKRIEEDEKEPLELPMSRQLEAIIKEAIQEYGNDTHVFGTKKLQYIDGVWRRGKTGSSSQRNYRDYINPYREHYGVGGKTNHDLRRTIETTLNNLGVPSDVTTAMTGHSRTGMKRTYNHAGQLHALRTGFQMYADFIDFLCERDVI